MNLLIPLFVSEPMLLSISDLRVRPIVRALATTFRLSSRQHYSMRLSALCSSVTLEILSELYEDVLRLAVYLNRHCGLMFITFFHRGSLSRL